MVDINWDIDDYSVSPIKITAALESDIENIALEQRKKLNAETLTGFDFIEALIKSGINIFLLTYIEELFNNIQNTIDYLIQCPSHKRSFLELFFTHPELLIFHQISSSFSIPFFNVPIFTNLSVYGIIK